MFDFLRDSGSTADSKRQEALSAYLDGALTAAERERFEAQLARDSDLRAELEQLRALKLQLRAMPRRRVPRSFALDPAVYGRPKAQPAMRLYPVLRGATALTAFLLIFTLALGAFRGQFGGDFAAPAAEITMSEAVEEAAIASQAVEEAAPAPMPTMPAAEERVMGTEAPRVEAAGEVPAGEMAAQEVVTSELSLQNAPLPEGTAAPDAYAGAAAMPESDLSPKETELAAQPTVEAVAEAMETSVAAFEAPPSGSAEAPVVDLLPLQIGLGIAFLLSLILWLVARRARSI